ncbi:LysR family transcriptional regulator [Phytoactinopolyspora halotolerans]|uniref:LysR family transcriptional regulator n=1 Tax=Phytoactinopolyspora halotolerans TaxID=1981512 RepID=A0A6L9S242_9ACTN|nr:LysR family transcriptional regulator [Phytoactinopolyspora halotolerans]NED99142.1 LysR family transcriptional regulator [Phytoactinopolyspora halotolerans]
MEIRQLEHFIAVAEEGHFTRAAERLMISQSGLSASIRSLERELGASLFHRNTRHVSLTDAGKALLVESHRTVASVAAAREAVASVQGLFRGTLAIGAEQCLGAVDVAALLAEFRASYPGIEIVLNQAGSSRLLDGVRSAQLDLAFVATESRAIDGIDLIHIMDEPMVVVCHPDSPWAELAKVEPVELLEATFVDFGPDWGARTVTDRMFSAAGLDRRVMLEVNDVHSLLDVVNHGLGLAVVPAHITRKQKASTLSVVELAGTDATWSVCVALPPENRRSQAARKMIDQLDFPEPPEDSYPWSPGHMRAAPHPERRR